MARRHNRQGYKSRQSRQNPTPDEWLMLAGNAAVAGGIALSFLKDARGKRLDFMLLSALVSTGARSSVYLAPPGTLSLGRRREIPPTLEMLADPNFYAREWDNRKRAILLGLEDRSVQIASGQDHGVRVKWLALPGDQGWIGSVGRTRSAEARINPPFETPAILRSCVADVSARTGAHRAFGICTASLQRAGKLKAGTREATDEGKRYRVRARSARARDVAYERALARARDGIRQ
jgi:hypothetical protein